MKVVVIGLGVQGNKRKKFAGEDFVAAVDPINPAADFKDIKEVPLTAYDAALVCLPDAPKYEVLKYLLTNGKHVLVEKPLWCDFHEQLLELQHIAEQRQVVCYTAYNHRFEPHYVRMKALIDSGDLGRIYHCRLFYGNGTARLVRDSAWRDQGTGVLGDLAPHLMDITSFWFGIQPDDFKIVEANCFENQALDHVIIQSQSSTVRLEFEMTLLSWRNHFTCDVLAERGSAHIESLCKWGPSRFIKRQRVLPSGRPPEKAVILTQEDPTWVLEYAYFKKCVTEKQITSLANDIWIYDQLKQLETQCLAAETIV